MLSDWVSNPGPLTYESGALPTALRGQANNSPKSDVNVSVSVLWFKMLCSQYSLRQVNALSLFFNTSLA